MVNYISTVKLNNEITDLMNRQTKNYCFILAENQEDEALQIWEHKDPNTTFIIVRKDKWQKEMPQTES